MRQGTRTREGLVTKLEALAAARARGTQAETVDATHTETSLRIGALVSAGRLLQMLDI